MYIYCVQGKFSTHLKSLVQMKFKMGKIEMVLFVSSQTTVQDESKLEQNLLRQCLVKNETWCKELFLCFFFLQNLLCTKADIIHKDTIKSNHP